MKKRIAIVAVTVMLLLTLCAPMTAAVAAEEFSYVIHDAAATVTGYNGGDTEVVVPDTLGGARVTAIGNNAFAASAVEAVTLPDSVQTIGECAFQHAVNLKRITIGSRLQTVEFSAFYGCTSLVSVQFGGTSAAWQRVTIHAFNDPLTAATITFGHTAVETRSLLPASAAAFERVAVNNASVTVTRLASGAYNFRSSRSWPYAYVDYGIENGIVVDTAAEQYLNYEFEVVSGCTNVAVLFNSPDPHAPQSGEHFCLNGDVDPSNVDYKGTVTDLRPGYYKGSIRISDLGCSPALMDGAKFVITGFRVYAVTSGWDGNGNVIVHDMSVGDSKALAALPQAARDGEKISLLPDSTNGFTGDDTQGPIYMTQESGGFRFESDNSWPFAYTEKAASEFVEVDITEDHYLYYDFTVTGSMTNICVYFGGVHPQSEGVYGTFISLNGLVDASNVNNGVVTDIGMGVYRGCVRIGDLGLHPSVLRGTKTTVSDIKVFAVSTYYEQANILVKEIAVIKPKTTTSSTTLTTTTTTTQVPRETVTYTVGDIVGTVGDVVQTTITVSDGHYMTNGQIVVKYDPTVLALKAVSEDTANPYAATLNEALFAQAPSWAFREYAPAEACLASATAAPSGVATGGVLFTVAFEIIGEAADGTTVTLMIPEMCSVVPRGDVFERYNTLTDTVAGTVQVNNTYARGDINGDGAVDIADATMLFRAANGRIVLTDDQERRAQLTEDDIVDIADAVKLFRYVNGRLANL